MMRTARTGLNRRWFAAGALAAAVGVGGAAGVAATTQPDATAIVGATVFDAAGNAPRIATVVIKNGRIAAVGPNVKPPRGARIIRADGEALLPGLIDVHTHWTPAGDPRLTPDIAAAYLAAGVTTVNDFNAAPESYEPRRRWLAALDTPHVNFAARISTPGGHGADWADTATTKWVNTPEAARAAVRAVAAYKPDVIKAFTDGWRYGSAPDNTSMDAWTLAALVDEAHKHDLKVLTHTVTIDKGKEAAQAKVDVIAHSLQNREVDQEVVERMKANGTFYAPTLAVYEPGKGGKAGDPADPKVRQALRKFDYALHNVKTLHDAGVVVALGTDAGMPDTPHGTSTLRELELLVRAGLTPTEALTAGSAGSAKALGQFGDRGSIEVGKRADLVLVKGRPWESIGDIRKTDRVFVDGRLVFGPGAVRRAADAAKAMPALPAKARIDDFERADGRTNLDTLRTDNADGGLDRTVQISTVIPRGPADHALSVAARMAYKNNAYAGVILPLSRGSIEPVDARAFHGLRFDIRGDGAYTVGVNSLTGLWTAEVSGGPAWKTVEIPFTALKKEAGFRQLPGPWTADDLVEIQFGGGRAPGQKMWFEIDNVEFY